MDLMIDQIGGETSVRVLVERFYDLIETLPEGAQILDLHLQGQGLTQARSAQFDFLCGFFGGRRHYEERHGHMNLRQIHAHVPFRPQDALDWLSVMDRALTDCAVQEPMKSQIMATFTRAAQVLVNSGA